MAETGVIPKRRTGSALIGLGAFLIFLAFVFLIGLFFLGPERAYTVRENGADKFTSWAISEGDDTERKAELPIYGKKVVEGGKYTLRENAWLALPIPSRHCIALQPSAGFEEKRIGDNYLLRSYGGNIEVKAFILEDGETLGSYTCT